MAGEEPAFDPDGLERAKARIAARETLNEARRKLAEAIQRQEEAFGPRCTVMLPAEDARAILAAIQENDSQTLADTIDQPRRRK